MKLLLIIFCAYARGVPLIHIYGLVIISLLTIGEDEPKEKKPKQMLPLNLFRSITKPLGNRLKILVS